MSRQGFGGVSPWLLYGLVLLAPFEHPRPLVHLFGIEMTFLEAAGAVALGLVAVDLIRKRPFESVPYLGFALAFLGVCLLSSAFAPSPRLLPLKFSLRVGTGVLAFALASVALREEGAVRRLLNALAIAGTVVAVVGLLETFGLPIAQRLTGVFRLQDFEVGGQRRLTATFAYPNLAAGFMVLGLAGALFTTARESVAKRTQAICAGAYLLMILAILLTYSRGALVGALVVPLGLLVWGRMHQRPGVTRRAALAFASVLVLALAVTLSNPAFRLRALSEGDASWYSADYRSDVEEIVLGPGELTQVPVTVRNTGLTTWEPEGEKVFHLSYHWYDPCGKRVLPIEGERTALPHAVRSGESVRLKTHVRAPRQVGRFLLVWDMVQEHTTWFVGKGGAGKFLSVVVGNPPPQAVAAVTPSDVARTIVRDSWFPGRLELWSIALKLFAENPLLGVGPDNYRWLYGPASGHTRWDTRVYSNSLYLETLATTGVLGAVTFFGLYTVSTLGLIRVVRGSEASLIPAALLTALLGFAVHGLFDYLLESTSIYVPFWILLGAASALTAVAREAKAREGRFVNHACWV